MKYQTECIRTPASEASIITEHRAPSSGFELLAATQNSDVDEIPMVNDQTELAVDEVDVPHQQPRVNDRAVTYDLQWRNSPHVFC